MATSPVGAELKPLCVLALVENTKNMKLHQCNVCGKVDVWSDSWSSYGSLFLEEEYPHLMPRACSQECQKIMATEIESERWRLPTLRMSGWLPTISKPQKGYQPQFNQRDLLEAYNRQRAKFIS